MIVERFVSSGGFAVCTDIYVEANQGDTQQCREVEKLRELTGSLVNSFLG